MIKKALKFTAASILVLCAGIDVDAAEINRDEINCLATNIYFESRGENVNGMLAVGYATLNRVKSKRFPNTICGVVKQNRFPNKRFKCQFSWYCDGLSDTPRKRLDYAIARQVAVAVVYGLADNPVDCADHYHAVSVKPIWRLKLNLLKRIGNHIFYCAN